MKLFGTFLVLFSTVGCVLGTVTDGPSIMVYSVSGFLLGMIFFVVGRLRES